MKRFWAYAQKALSLARSGARVPIATGGLLVILAAAVFFVGTPSGAVEVACTLTIKSLEVENVHTTRVEGFSAAVKSASETVHYAFEYATSREGPWNSARSGTAIPRAFEGTVGEFNFGSGPVHHLTPETPYFGRLIVENGCAVAFRSFEFTTTTVGAPEVIGLTLNPVEGGEGTATGLEYADREAEIENNGATETEYRFEVRKPGDAWPGVAAPGTGTSGTVTQVEDFVEAEAHITGLTPETKYELRVVAESELGKAETNASFTTVAHQPEAFMSEISGVGVSSARVNGAVRARSAETHWSFEYATSETGPWKLGQQGTIAETEAGEGFHQVEGELTGLAGETKYFVRLHADNGTQPVATSSPVGFETAGLPVALTFTTHTYAPGGEIVRVIGSVEPHGIDTHYHFEYVSEEDFAVSEWASAMSTPGRSAGSGAFSQRSYPALIVGEDLPDLQPGKTYYYRLVTTNAQGTVDGSDHVLMVPAPAPVEEPACSNESLRRSGPSAHLPDCRGYELVTPAEKEGSMDNWAYSGNVSTPALVGEDGKHVMVRAQFSHWGSNIDATDNAYFFAREEGTGWRMTSATPQPSAADHSYRPSVFSADLTQIGLNVGWSSTLENVSPNLELVAGAPGGPYTTVMSAPRSSEPEWVAASSDFATLILSKAGKLSEWSGGELRQIDNCAATMGKVTGGGAPGGAVSAGGARVFFEAASGSGCSGAVHLFMRVNHGSDTVDVGAYRFLAANADASSVLVEARSGEEKYEYLLYDARSKAVRPLLSAHEQLHLTASSDLSTIYVSSAERLTPEAPPLSAESEDAGPAPEELYRYDIAEAKLRFIVQSSHTGGYTTSDGRYYYWESEGVAAVYNPIVKEEEMGQIQQELKQVYRYDSVENVVECMSCASSFAPKPKRFAIFLAADVGRTAEETVDGLPSSTVVSDNGDYAFFDTAAALVPQDANGELPAGTNGYFVEEHDFFYSPSSDVYEWRKDGIDGCSHAQGCLALISSGTGGLKNMLLGTADDGHDVFFMTHSQLVGQDTDGQGDLYDARIGGGFPPPAPAPTECEGDACLSPLSAPIDTTPASLSFSGPGNLAPPGVTPKVKRKAKPCKRGAVRSKGRCVKRRPRKRAGRAKHTARHNRRGGG
ncbi:MAG: hypothetical protein ACRD4Q_00825 [Candidatus Acidiferrales bacterium]